MTAARRCDVVIVGGGIAGLWLANRLSTCGYSVVLLQSGHLGDGQTLASQGMIHGGLKYALSGALSAASEAIAGMPGRWAACLDGRGDVDLSGLEPLSNAYYLFAGDSALGRLTSFFASRALRGRIERLQRSDFPGAFQDPGFAGVVYRLNDFVLDTGELMAALQRPIQDRCYRLDVCAESMRLLGGMDPGVELTLPDGPLLATRLVLAAGAGTQALLDGLGIRSPRMQLRPLHQVLVRQPGLPPLYAHCLTGVRRAEPRLTITSHRDGDGWLWYLGGQIAGDGVAMSAPELAEHARVELAHCVPWIDWRRAQFSALRIDRAEPEQQGRLRPDQAFASAAGPCIVAWPTKLSLAPDLGDRVLDLLSPPSGAPQPVLALPPAHPGRPPWEGPLRAHGGQDG